LPLNSAPAKITLRVHSATPWRQGGDRAEPQRHEGQKARYARFCDTTLSMETSDKQKAFGPM